jgi:hypothetical protein
MNISYQFQSLAAFLTKDRFVAVLKREGDLKVSPCVRCVLCSARKRRGEFLAFSRISRPLTGEGEGGGD